MTVAIFVTLFTGASQQPSKAEGRDFGLSPVVSVVVLLIFSAVMMLSQLTTSRLFAIC